MNPQFVDEVLAGRRVLEICGERFFVASINVREKLAEDTRTHGHVKGYHVTDEAKVSLVVQRIPYDLRPDLSAKSLPKTDVSPPPDPKLFRPGDRVLLKGGMAWALNDNGQWEHDGKTEEWVR